MRFFGLFMAAGTGQRCPEMELAHFASFMSPCNVEKVLIYVQICPVELCPSLVFMLRVKGNVVQLLGKYS